MRRGSSWRGTESFTLEAYRGRFRRPLHPLSASKFVWRFFFFLDSMHVFDCKGTASTIFGSVLSTLVRDVRLGANQQQRLDLINTRLRSFYSRNPKLHKLPKITLNNLEGSNGWAELVGSAIKAAQTRAAAPFFAELAREFFNSDTPEDLNTCRVTSSMSDIYEIIAGGAMFLTQDELRRFGDAVDEFGISMQSLRHVAHMRSQLAWQVRPKCHKAMHMPLFASIINPGSLNCYVRESQIGTSQRVWRSSVKGRHHNHAQRTVLAKRWLGLLLRIEHGS